MTHIEAEQSASTVLVPELCGVEFCRLCTLFATAEGSWAIGVCDSAHAREMVEHGLHRAMAPLPVHHLSLLDRPNGLEQHLGNFSRELGAPVVLLHPLPVSEELRIFCYNLDIRREALARLSHRLLIWADENEWRFIAEHAPNFYSRISGVYCFS